jgi:hypothetical protein
LCWRKPVRLKRPIARSGLRDAAVPQRNRCAARVNQREPGRLKELPTPRNAVASKLSTPIEMLRQVSPAAGAVERAHAVARAIATRWSARTPGQISVLSYVALWSECLPRPGYSHLLQEQSVTAAARKS